jgi:exosome complex component RRP42
MSVKSTEEYVLSLIENGKRLDGRKLDEFRKVEINYDVSVKAEGSAEVKLGNTHVIAGVKLDIGEPYPDTPEKGVLITSAEYLAMAAPEFEPGMPGEDEIELARVVDRGIRESKAIDLEQLCIVPGEKVWTVFVDIFVINHDGNLIDASVLAAIAALLNTKIPALDEEGNIDRSKREKALPMRDIPIAITFRKHKDKMILDTTAIEENVLPGKFTVTTKANGNICAMQLSGGISMTKDEIIRATKLAQKYSDELRKKYFASHLKSINV